MTEPKSWPNVTEAELREIGEALGIKYDAHGQAIYDPPPRPVTANELKQAADYGQEKDQAFRIIKGGKF